MVVTAGVGKTHHIRQLLCNIQYVQTIAVNEAFTRESAIRKLNKLPRNNEDCAIFFNFTMLAPGVSGTYTMWLLYFITNNLKSNFLHPQGCSSSE